MVYPRSAKWLSNLKIDQYNSPHQQTKSRNKGKSQQTQDKLFTKSTIQHNSRGSVNGLRLPGTTKRSPGGRAQGGCPLGSLLWAALRVLSSAQQSRTDRGRGRRGRQRGRRKKEKGRQERRTSRRGRPTNSCPQVTEPAP